MKKGTSIGTTNKVISINIIKINNMNDKNANTKHIILYNEYKLEANNSEIYPVSIVMD